MASRVGWLKYEGRRIHAFTRAFARFFYEHSRIKDINVTARDLIKTKTRRLLRLHSTLGRRSATVTNAILESSGGHF